jgi:hypothetical protein
LVAFVTVAVNDATPPDTSVTADGDTETATGCTGGKIVTGAVADLLESACATAETVTALGLGTLDGAVYRPSEAIEPTTALPPGTALTCQTTDVSLELVTVAVNRAVPPAATTLAEVGEIETSIVGVGGAPPPSAPPPPPPPPHADRPTTSNPAATKTIVPALAKIFLPERANPTL